MGDIIKLQRYTQIACRILTDKMPLSPVPSLTLFFFMDMKLQIVNTGKERAKVSLVMTWAVVTTFLL